MISELTVDGEDLRVVSRETPAGARYDVLDRNGDRINEDEELESPPGYDALAALLARARAMRELSEEELLEGLQSDD